MTIPDISKWMERNRFVHSQFLIPEMTAAVQEKGLRITVIIPAREVASTIGMVIQKAVLPLVDARIVHRVCVIDAASTDGTAMVAKAAGAEVLQREDIAREMGPSRGKGDALWRALLATDGDLVAFLDGDTEDPVAAHLIGILGPLIFFDRIEMVRGCFDRPFKETTGEIRAHDGGRVTEILARPILNLYWPELAGFRQPLAGEIAARRSLLERLHFPTGYGIEIVTLIDAYRLVGLEALAEVDIGQRQNAHKPLRDLTLMAATILAAAEEKRESLERNIRGIRMYLPWSEDYREIVTAERPSVENFRKFHSRYPAPPFIMVEGVRIFRDVGAHAASRMRRGLVFRSGDLSKITLHGLKRLLDLGISKVFDLRSPCEYATGAETASDGGYGGMLGKVGIERVAVPVLGDDDWRPEKNADRLRHYTHGARGYAKVYGYMLRRGAAAFRPILRYLARPDPAPMLVHCTAGKDRTGLVIMLILLLAGCEAGFIASEYALSDLDHNGSWGVGAVSRLLDHPEVSGKVSAAENIVRAHKSYMLAVLRAFKREYGSVESYLRKVIQLDSGTIRRLRRNIVAYSGKEKDVREPSTV